MKQELLINACCGESAIAFKGSTITVIDIDGGQVVDFFAESASDPLEFLSTGVTIDCNESLKLKEGDVIYSNLYNPMFRVMYDDVGAHDLLHPCCRTQMYEFFYHNGFSHPNCLDNINACLHTKRPIVHPVNLFMNTAIGTDGSIKVLRPLSKAGDKIVLRAETDVRLGIAACSVSESDCNGGKCTPIMVIIE